MFINLILLTIIWLLVELGYFKVAQRFAIVDKPNARSSHQYITIRGGGIIFPLAAIVFFPLSSIEEIIFCVSILTISILSFLDDIKPIDSLIRLIIQSIAVAGLLFFFAGNLTLVWFPVLFILITGVINAYNFMDGINGITILYSSLTIGSIYWVHTWHNNLMPDLFFISLFASFIVFSFFNLRKKAKCFAGDVGSVSLAFLICFLLLKLTMQTGFIYWIFFLGVYGIDTVFTIFCRILRKEPLMQAHRSHFYQYLANEAGWGHLKVSFMFVSAQLLLNVLIICAYQFDCAWLSLVILFAFLSIYTIFRLRFEGSKRLFVSYNPT